MITVTPDIGQYVIESALRCVAPYTIPDRYPSVYIITEITPVHIVVRLISTVRNCGKRVFFKTSKQFNTYSINDFHKKFDNNVREQLEAEFESIKAPYEKFYKTI